MNEDASNNLKVFFCLSLNRSYVQLSRTFYFFTFPVIKMCFLKLFLLFLLFTFFFVFSTYFPFYSFHFFFLYFYFFPFLLFLLFSFFSFFIPIFFTFKTFNSNKSSFLPGSLAFFVVLLFVAPNMILVLSLLS